VFLLDVLTNVLDWWLLPIIRKVPNMVLKSAFLYRCSALSPCGALEFIRFFGLLLIHALLTYHTINLLLLILHWKRTLGSN